MLSLHPSLANGLFPLGSQLNIMETLRCFA